MLSWLCHGLRVPRCSPQWFSEVSQWLWCQWDITSWLLVAPTSGPFPGSAAPAAWTDRNAESHCPELWQCVTLISCVPSVSPQPHLSPVCHRALPSPQVLNLMVSSGAVRAVLALHAQLQTS